MGKYGPEKNPYSFLAVKTQKTLQSLKDMTSKFLGLGWAEAGAVCNTTQNP